MWILLSGDINLFPFGLDSYMCSWRIFVLGCVLYLTGAPEFAATALFSSWALWIFLSVQPPEKSVRIMHWEAQFFFSPCWMLYVHWSNSIKTSGLFLWENSSRIWVFSYKNGMVFNPFVQGAWPPEELFNEGTGECGWLFEHSCIQARWSSCAADNTC